MTRRRPRAFTLFEIVLALTLLATFAVVSTKLLRTTLRVSYEVGDVTAAMSRFDGALSQLRRDVWDAVKLESADMRTIQVQTSSEGTVTWRVQEDGSLVRSAASESSSQNWVGVGRGITFEIDGPVLLLVEQQERAAAPRRMPLISQVAISKRGQS